MKNLAQLVLIWCLDAAKMLERGFRSCVPIKRPEGRVPCLLLL